MRMLLFFKPKNGFQFAGSGLDSGSGGGGGGGGSIDISTTPSKIGKLGNDDLYIVRLVGTVSSSSFEINLPENTNVCYVVSGLATYDGITRVINNGDTPHFNLTLIMGSSISGYQNISNNPVNYDIIVMYTKGE